MGSSKEKAAAYYQLNKEKYAAAFKARYAQNRDAMLARYRAWRKANPEKAKQCRAKWNDENRERVRERDIRHQARRRASRSGATIGDQKLILHWHNGWKRKAVVRCYWCEATIKPKSCHIDHMVALSRGGAHEVQNLCISCGPCNLKKQDKSVSEWNSLLVSPILL